MGDLTGIITGVVSAIGAVLVAALGWLSARRSAAAQKVTADAQADATVAGEWRTLYTELRGEMRDLRAAVTELQSRVDEAEARADASEARERRIILDFMAVFEWIERGAQPPPPTRPDYLHEGVKR